MPRYFIPGNNSLSQSNIDTNNVCPCANNINTKVINSSNSCTLQNYTQVEKRVNLLRYPLGGRTMFGNYNPYVDREIIAEAIALAANVNAVSHTTLNTTSSVSELASASSVASSLALSASDLNNPNLFLRCIGPPSKKCSKPIRNKF